MTDAASRRPTVYDVAQEAGVSIASVSFAFRRPERISEATRERVLAAARRLGYAPSAAARGLANGRTGILGLHAFDLMLERAEPRDVSPPRPDARPTPLPAGDIIPWSLTDDETLADPRAFPLYVDEVQRGFALECWMLGRPVVLSSGSDSDVSVADTAGRVDGLAIFPSPVLPAALLRMPATIPTVLFSVAPGDDPHHRVRVDNAGGMRGLIDHLVHDHGYDDVAFVGRQEGFDNTQRFLEYRASLARWGQRPREEPIDGTVRGPHRMVEQLADLQARGALPRALVCATDQHALMALDALSALGVRVPEQVAVTGFDGILAGRLSVPALTSVRQPMEAMGRAAARILAGKAGPVPEGQSRFDAVFAPRLLIRHSCGC
ncbi:LacI family DNA-binding transcriptional regulator [Microbacterium sp. VKM Ac-2870]|uniref:LacI family DNA-binding transcriptional regulator n=1 Tax=Microbacterium sp. VKM Ac-2870 TaxID=2783825 RepID=UPI00188B8FE9|nr:LacI family DNA-binding transcriptional regulator [Microbacterium sp. VKM Ac-2870]MBF4563082.1 LacI family DNA-binding transcriptional regulator [Microbacterium sp. VKM Ac-2870]